MTKEENAVDSTEEVIIQQMRELGIDPSKIDPEKFEAAAKEAEKEIEEKQKNSGEEGGKEVEQGEEGGKEVEQGEEGGEAVEMQQEKKKKKKKKKSKGQRKFPPPTGFEDYFVEGPISPEKLDEELELYSQQKPFSERIETCIQRYKARRKFDPLRIQIFTEYLNLGGVTGGPKQFSGGLDLKHGEELDAEQISQLTATDYVRQDDDDDELEVDFEYVARGFLSHKVPYVMGYMKFDQLELSAKVLRNFLNYVIYHNVCPEHESGVRDAIKICDLAEKELVLCRQVSSRLPGDFNMACSTLFEGFYQGMHSELYTWDSGPAATIGLSEDEAKEIYFSGISQCGTAHQQELGLNARVISKEFLGLEVVDILFPGRETEGGTGRGRGPKALGKLSLKVWAPEGEEMPETELKEFEIWLEKEVLQWAFLGMHLEAKVHCMSNGLVWIDSVTAVQCSFYLYLETPEKPDSREGDFEEYD